MLFQELRRVVEAGERAVVLTVVEGERVGAKLLVLEDGRTLGEAPPELAELAPAALRRGRSHVVEADGLRVFADVYGPPPRLVVYGAVDTAEALCRGAKLLGWTAIVADARARFATRERVPSADEIVGAGDIAEALCRIGATLGWRTVVVDPRRGLHELVPSADEIVAAWPDEVDGLIDSETALVSLVHEERLDLPALRAAVEGGAFYVGALGSRRNQERRRERLLEAGVADADIDRIAGPCGLDIGAESPAETALSILAEILALRAGRTGGPLKDAKTRIHVEPAAQAISPA